ncbi:MAG: hypothetical protein HOV84_17500 [Streptomyces sp.]|nr:hypothetical protein [Streptomyces sp.]
MTVTEPTPLHPRSQPPFHQMVREIVGSDVEQATVDRITAVHAAELRQKDTQLDSYRRSEADAHAQHWVSWRMLEFVQSTMSQQLRRAAQLHARCEQSATIIANVRRLVDDAQNAGRPVSVVDLQLCLSLLDVRPVLPQTMLAIVPDHAYTCGVFEGNADGAPVTYRFPYYGVALVTTNTEPERITEPCFMAGERILTASAIGQQMGVTLKTYE